MKEEVRKSTEQRLGEVIRELINEYHLENRLNETRLISQWEVVTGRMIARHTTRLNIKNRVLFVTVDSAAVRQELSFARSKLIRNLNKKCAADVIDDIVFL